MKKLSSLIFKYRSYTPVPFFVIILIFEQATTITLLDGFFTVLIGEAIRFWGVSYAGSETRTGDIGGSILIVSGPFAYVRNPLYLGNILIYVGIGIMSNAFFPYIQIIGGVFFLLQYKIIIDGEEKYLFERFTNEYQDYFKAVPRFLPRFTKYKYSNITQPVINFRAGLRSERDSIFALLIAISLLLFSYLASNFGK